MTQAGGYRMESAESRALRSISADSYDYRDQAKLITKLTGDVTYMAQYMRQMQKGIDAANENFIQQIQDFIEEIMVVIGGRGNTGFDFGDLKYVFQAIGALFGFDEQTGIAKIFPINLFDAAWHFFSTYILQLNNFKDRIDAFIDNAIATILDIFGEIPIVGQALQKLATWILDFRDAVRNGQEVLGGIFSDWTQSLVDSIKETIEVIKDIVEWFTGQRQSVRIKFLEWAQRLPIMNALNGTILGNNIPNLDASKISTGQFDQGRITNLTNSLAGKAEVSAYKLRAKAGLNLVISPNFDQTLPAILRCTYNGNVWTSTGYTAVQSKNGMTSWTWTANGTNQEGVRFAPTELDYAIDVVPGETYYVEAYYFAKSTNSSAAGYLQIGAEFNNSVAGIGVVTVNNSAITKGQWNQISGYFQVPANATEAYVWICSSSNTPNGNVYYVDAVVLKEVTNSSKIAQGLFNSNTVLPTVLPAVIPGLDASKVTSGTLSTSTIPNLDSGKITTGTLGTSRIPDLDSAKIATGTLATARIPSLDASKVTTGTLATSTIPTLPQSKIQDLTAELSTLSVQRADNFASNPGFENSNFPVQCFYGRSAYSTTVKRNGTQSIRTTGVEGIWPLYNYRQATEIPVAQGDTFYAEIWVYPATTNVNTDGHIDLTVYTTGGPTGSFIDANDYPAFKDPLGGLLVNNIPKGQWTKLSGYYTVPAGVSTIKLLCYVSPYVPGSAGTQDTNNIYYWDDPAIYRVTETEKINKVLFNESEPSSTVLASAIPGFDASKIISGTMADDRVAFLRENFATLKISLRDAENLVADGSFEYDPVPWDIDPSLMVYNGFAIDNTVARSGTRSLKIDNNFYAITYCNGWTLEGFAPGTYGNPTPRWVTVSPGEKIYVEFWARRTAAYVDQAPTGNMADSSAFMVVGPDQMAFADPATGQGTYIYFSALQVPTANTWTKISKVITIPSSGVDRISFKIMGPITLGGFAWIDDIVVRRVLSTERFADNSIGNNKISDISGDKVNAGTVGAGYIASLDASKITTGTLATTTIPNLDSGKITTGTLSTSRIPALDAGKITTGTLATSTIPNLDASKVTTGTLATTTIPNLDAGKITTGTLSGATIPALDASKITTGNFTQSRVTNLTTDLAAKLSQAVYSAKAKAGVNLIPAPSFEITTVSRFDYRLQTWSTSGYSTEQKRTGLRSWKWTTDAGNWNGIRLTPTEYDTAFDVVAGEKYYVELWYYAPSTNTMTTGALYLNAHGYAGGVYTTGIAFASVANTAIVTNQWNKLSGYGTIPAGIDSISPYILSDTSTPAGNVYYIDDVVFKEATESTGIKQGLFGSNSVLSNILTAVVPSLDASKVTSGTFAAATIPALDAGKVTTGTFGTGLIPNLDAGKITTGSFGSSFITDGAVSNVKLGTDISGNKIAAGTVGAGFIAALDASKISTGTFGTGLIPSLDAAKVTTGSFLTSLIPALDASKVTTGNFAQSRVTNLTTDLGTINTTTGRLSAVTARRIESQANIVTDPACSQAEVWTYYSNCTLAVSTEQFRSSPSSLKMSIINTAYAGFTLVQDGTATWLKMPCTEGDVFYAECYVRSNAANTNTKQAYIQFLSHDTVSGGADYAAGTWANSQPLVTPNSTAWQKISGYFTVPANRDKISIWFYVGNLGTTGDSYYVDDIHVQRVTEANQINKTIFNSNTPLASLLSAVIPSLDASKIGTGTFGTGLIPALDAAKVTTGTFGTGLIPSLDAAKVTTGSFLTSLIPALDASKVTTGNFAQSRVTNLTTDLTNAQNATTTVASRLDQKIASGQNLCTNPGFEDTSQYLWDGTYSTTQFRSGARSAAITTTGTDKYLSLVSSTAGSVRVSSGPSRSYYIEGWIFGDTANTITDANTSRIGLGIWAYNSANAYVNYAIVSTSVDAIGKGSWVKLSGTVTLPSTSTIANIRVLGFVSLALAAGNTWYFDDVMVVDVTEIVNTNTTLFNNKTPLASILSAVVPSLDASKISTGTLGTGLIPALDTSKITTGTFGSGFIADGAVSNLKLGTDIDGSKIAVGTVGAARIPTLDGSKIGSGTIAANFIAALDAAKIATGTFLSNLIPALDTSKITTGTFGTGFLADGAVSNIKLGIDIDGSKIAVGSVAAARIAALDASKISTGTFGTGLIPSLDAAKVTTGSFLTSLIPALDASKVTTGNFAQSRVTNLTTDLSNTTSLISINSLAGANLVDNVGFESNLFYAGGGSWSTEQAYTGTQSWKYTHAGVNNWTNPFFANTTGTLRKIVKPDDVFYVEFMVYPHASNAAGTTSTVMFYFRVEDKTGTQISTPSFWINTAAMTKGAWNKVSGYITLDGNAANTTAIPNISWGSTAEGTNTYYFDNPIIYRITEAANTNTTLFNSKTPLANILSAVVPSLDASKISTGTLGTGLIPSLDAAKIATGTFLTGLIPALDSSKITTGSFAQSRVTNLTNDLNSAITSGSSILPNGGFENTSFYTGNGVYDNTVKLSGSYSMRLTGPNQRVNLTANTVGNSYPNTTQPCRPSSTWYVEGWVYGDPANTGGGIVSIYIDDYDAAGTLQPQQSTSWSATTAMNGVWTKISTIKTVSANAASVYIFTWQANNPATDKYYYDNFVAYEITEVADTNTKLFNSKTPLSSILATVVPALDASKVTTGTLGTGIIPNITKAMSTDLNTAATTLLGVIGSGDSIVVDGGYEYGSVRVWSGFSRSTEQAHTGTYSLKVTGNLAYISQYAPRDDTNILNYWCNPGDVFYMEVWVYGHASNVQNGGGVIFMGAGAYKQDNTLISYPLGAQVTVTPSLNSTWTKLSGYVTAPANTARLIFYYQLNNGVQATETFYFDDFTVRPYSQTATVTSALYGQLTPLSNVLSSVVPALDAAKITTGTFGSTFITDGAVSNAKLGTDISGDKIVAGTVLAARVGALDASKITGGTFGTSLIPALDAAKISTGTFLSNLIPALDAAKIATGTFLGNLIPALDAAKITTGTLGTGLIPNITKAMSTDLSNIFTGSTTRQKAGNNVIPNGSFEDSSFGVQTYYGMSVSTDVAHSGTKSLKCVADGTWKYSFVITDIGSSSTAYVKIPVTPGDVWYYETWVYGKATNVQTSGGASGVRLHCQTYDSSEVYNGDLAAYLGTASTAFNSVWTKVGGYVTVPDTVRYMSPYVAIHTSVTVGDTYYFDDFTLYRVTEAANTNTTLFNSKTPLANILSSIIPGLDAAKITTGTFSNAMIASGLDAAKLTTGTLPTARIGTGAITNTYLGTDIDGSKIGAGSVAAARIAALDTSKITTGTFGNAFIGLNAIGTTNIQDTAVTGAKTTGLDGSKITTGTIAESVIASLSASKIGSGLLDLLRIPSLPTSQITSGTFGTAFIADGAITTAKIPDAAVTGVKTAALDASKVTTGTMAQAQVTSLTTDLSNRVDYSAYLSYLSGGASNLATNPSFEDTTQYLWSAQANTNATYVRSGTRSLSLTSTGGVYKYIGVCTSKTGEIYIQGGPNVRYYYEYYVKGDASNTTTGSGIATRFGIWYSDSAKVGIGAVYGTGLTYDQIGTTGWVKDSGYITVPSTATIAFHRPIIHIPNSIGTFYFDDVLFEDVTEITNTNVALFNQNTPASTIITGAVPAIDGSKINTGTLAEDRIASLSAGKITSGTFADARIPSLATSKITSGTFGTAFIADDAITNAKIGPAAVTGTEIATGTIATTNIADAAVTGVKTSGLDASKITGGTIGTGILPPGTGAVGSGLYMKKTGGGLTALAKGANRFLTSFYDGTTESTSDIVVSSDASGYLKATATYTGWYLVEIAFGLRKNLKTYQVHIAPLVYLNGTPYKMGAMQCYFAGINIGNIYPQNAAGTFIVKMNAGDYTSPGAYVVSDWATGSTQDLLSNDNAYDTYFAVSLLNRSLA